MVMDPTRLTEALVRSPRLQLLLVTIAFASGAAIAWAAIPVGGETSARPSPAEPAFSAPRLEQLAAGELARSRAAHRRLAPTLDRARKVARDVERRYRLPGGRRLAVAEVATTLPVASLELMTSAAGPSRSVATDNGIYFALCGRGARRHCAFPAANSGRAAAFLARRQGLELALRTFRETPATLVVVSLPQSATRAVLLVFERDTAPRGDWRELLRSLERARPGTGTPALLSEVDRVTRARLFAPHGLTSLSETQESLVAVALALS
jgi:hypothetical protein